MYIDFDNGTMQFGSDTEFFGTAFSGSIPTDEPMYPIVTGSLKGAIISIVYRGEGQFRHLNPHYDIMITHCSSNIFLIK